MDVLFALSMNLLLNLQHAVCYQCLAEILHSNAEMPSFEGRTAMPLLLWFSCHAQNLTCPCVWNEEPWCSLPAPDSQQCRWSHCVPIPVISASLGQQLLVLIIELHRGSLAKRQFFPITCFWFACMRPDQCKLAQVTPSSHYPCTGLQQEHIAGWLQLEAIHLQLSWNSSGCFPRVFIVMFSPLLLLGFKKWWGPSWSVRVGRAWTELEIWAGSWAAPRTRSCSRAPWENCSKLHLPTTLNSIPNPFLLLYEHFIEW